MEYRGVNHVVLVTDDMDKTVRFYRDFLGMPVVATLGGEVEGERMRHYFFGLGTQSCLAFFEWPGVELASPKKAGAPASGRQFDHVSISVDSEESLLDLQRRAREKGIEVSDVIDHSMVRSVYMEDPNGIALEFAVWIRDIRTDPPVLRDEDPVAALRD